MNQSMNMLMSQNKPETIESLNDTIKEIGKLALKLGEYMPKTIGQRQDEALERDTENHLNKKSEQFDGYDCSNCGTNLLEGTQVEVVRKCIIIRDDNNVWDTEINDNTIELYCKDCSIMKSKKEKEIEKCL